MLTTVSIDYLRKLEQAVLDAEWWLSDYKVAARKDPRGEKKRGVYTAADSVRERAREDAQ
jgi:hypothetical protein